MFKKSPHSSQLNVFTSSESLFSGNSLRMYEDESAWHNQFRKQVTMQIDEDTFSPLYCQNNGTPNASIRILVAMMVLKEAEGMSDQKLFENCRFNLLTRSALGLHNADDPLPTESTYYLFRKRVLEYADKMNENLFETVFAQITKSQCAEFEVSGKRIRMDSKLLGSNIAWLSRYELIHETLRLFYKSIKKSTPKDSKKWNRIDELLSVKGNKVVYISSSQEIRSRIEELGALIYKILPLFASTQSPHYDTLKRVFDEQYKVDQNKVVIPREKKEISAKSMQSPHDPDCNYRDKGNQKVKGYSVNVTESCDDEESLNLIAQVAVKKASTSDVDFLQTSIDKAQEVFTGKPEAAHADGAYHSSGNQQYCKEKEIDLHLHAIQGAKGRYEFYFCKKGELTVLDIKHNTIMEVVKIIGKNQTIKWRINASNGYRYFTQKDIDGYLLRKQIAETPIETLQKRNNVEATIFQLGYHYPNAKTRYRGEIKHQMWANMRCLWLNFVRILKYNGQLVQKRLFALKFDEKSRTLVIYLELKLIFTVIKTMHLPSIQNFQFSLR